MNNTSQAFGLFIDNIRSSRNISREDFVEGILSTRQFQRYLKGESTITNDKIFQLVDKLEMNILNVYKLFINLENTEYKLVHSIYNLILKYNYKDAFSLINNTNESVFSSKYNLSFFKYCKITTLYNLKRISVDMAMDQYKILIDYPDCLAYEDVNFIELITLISLSSYQLLEKQDKKIAYFLYEILKEENLGFDSEASNKLPSLFVATCQSLGNIGEYDKALNLAQQGINICVKNQIMNSLPHLFYYKALSLMHLDKKNEALIVVKKTFMILEIQNNTSQIEIFNKYLHSHFNIDKSDLSDII